MLSWFRNNTSSVGMIILIGLLILSFAFWDVQSYFNQTVTGNVAVVNDKEISISEWQEQFNNRRQQMMSQFGENLEPDYFDNPMIRRGFLDQLINSELLKQVATENGYVPSASALQQSIQEIPAFQNENGTFDKESYAFFLSQRNMSPAAFEELLKQDITLAAANDFMLETMFVTPLEAQQHKQLTSQTRSFEYFVIKPTDYLEGIEPSEEEIQSYYEENENLYMTDEKISVDYIEIKASDIADSIEIDEAVAEDTFEKRKEQYKRAEQRKTSHILVNLSASASDEDKTAALEKIQGLKKQLDDGADFAELAKEHSDDPGSAPNGGDLGWVETGDMVAPFEEALFEMQTGSISEPVLSQFGYHLIQLEEIKPEGYPEFAEVRNEVIAALQAERSQSEYLSLANEVNTAVLDAETDLIPAAELAGVEIKTTELFTRRGGSGIAANPEFVSAAFSVDVKDESLNSGAINISDSQVAFLRLNAYEPSELKELSEVKEQIIGVLKNQAARDKAEEIARASVEKIKTGEQTIAEAAEANNVELVTAENVGRTGSAQPFTLVKNVFELPRPTESVNPVAMLDSNANELAIVKLNAVTVAEATDVAEAQTAQLERNIRNNEIQIFVTALKEAADISINEDLMSQN